MGERCHDCNSDDLVCADCLVYPLLEKVSTLCSRLRTGGTTGSRSEALKEVEDALDGWWAEERSATSQQDALQHPSENSG